MPRTSIFFSNISSTIENMNVGWPSRFQFLACKVNCKAKAHKILQNLQRKFVLCINGQILATVEISQNFVAFSEYMKVQFVIIEIFNYEQVTLSMHLKSFKS